MVDVNVKYTETLVAVCRLLVCICPNELKVTHFS